MKNEGLLIGQSIKNQRIIDRFIQYIDLYKF